jgi:hypothetical protein
MFYLANASMRQNVEKLLQKTSLQHICFSKLNGSDEDSAFKEKIRS